ncbi:MAG: MFS transporter, partial [Actinobacteria bacterium]|nr:MFS transporter [Actinomycetota bacterium]
MTAPDVPAGQESASAQGGDPVTSSRPEAQAAVSWNAFLATYLPALILALGTGIAVPAIPTLARSFQVSFALASGVVTAYVLGNLLGTLPAGWLIDRMGARVVLIAAPLVTMSMAFSIAVVHSFSVLLALRFVDGCAAQMWLMARLASISHGAPPGQRGRQISWMFGMNNTGKLVGPVLGGLLAADFGVRSSFVAYGLLAMLAWVAAVRYGHDTPRRPRRGDRGHRTLSVWEVVGPRLVYFGVALFAGLARGPVQADLLHL